MWVLFAFLCCLKMFNIFSCAIDHSYKFWRNVHLNLLSIFKLGNLSFCYWVVSILFFCKLINFNWKLIILQYCSGFCHTLTWISHGCTCVPHPEPPSHHLPIDPSGSSQCTSPEHPVSCIEPELVIYFTYGNIHVSMLFSQIIPPSPSSTESKILFSTSVSLLLSHIYGQHYHLSKFHIYVLLWQKVKRN